LPSKVSIEGGLYGKAHINNIAFVHFCTAVALTQRQGVLPLVPLKYLKLLQFADMLSLLFLEDRLWDGEHFI
jgi:hypothetical protein